MQNSGHKDVIAPGTFPILYLRVQPTNRSVSGMPDNSFKATPLSSSVNAFGGA